MAEWVETKSGNRIAKDAELRAPDKIRIKGMLTICSGVVMYGDVKVSDDAPSISTGKCCYIANNSKILPPVLKKVDDVNYYSPVRLGSYVVIGQNVELSLAAVGNRVLIEDDCKLGDLSIVYDCCVIEKGCQIPPKMVISPFSRVRGVPGVDFNVSELPSGYKKAIEMEAKELQIIGRH